MNNLAKAVATNDRRKSLVALRDVIARKLDTCESGRDVAALSKRLMEVMEEIDDLPNPNAKPNPLKQAQKAARK